MGQINYWGNEVTCLLGRFLLGACEVERGWGTREPTEPWHFSIPGKAKLRLDLYLICHFRAVSAHHWLIELQKTGLEQILGGHLAHAPTPRQESPWFSHSQQVNSSPAGSPHPPEMEITEAPQATNPNASLPSPLESFTFCLICLYLGAM